jgi:hypothetical protein
VAPLPLKQTESTPTTNIPPPQPTNSLPPPIQQAGLNFAVTGTSPAQDSGTGGTGGIWGWTDKPAQ